jgi:hypothetical protein
LKRKPEDNNVNDPQSPTEDHDDWPTALENPLLLGSGQSPTKRARNEDMFTFPKQYQFLFDPSQLNSAGRKAAESTSKLDTMANHHDDQAMRRAVSLESVADCPTVFAIPASFSTERFHLTPYQKSATDLHGILSRSGTSLALFDEIFQWAKKSAAVHALNFSSDSLHTRRTFFSNLATTFPTPKATTTAVELELPEKRRRNIASTSIIHHWDFREQLIDLLTDSNLMGDVKNNLVVNPLDPFLPYPPLDPGVDDFEIDEIAMGEWYEETVLLYTEKYGFDPKRDFLLGVVLSLDKSGVLGNQRIGLEPMVFSLILFKLQLRRQARAWRHLGFIPDIDALSQARKHQSDYNSADGAGRSIRNYHKCVEVILRSFLDFQNLCHVKECDYDRSNDIPLILGNQVSNRRIFTPLSVVVGDGKNGDGCAGRKHITGDFNKNRIERIAQGLHLVPVLDGKQSTNKLTEAQKALNVKMSGKTEAQKALYDILHGRISRGCTQLPHLAGSILSPFDLHKKQCSLINQADVKELVLISLGKVPPTATRTKLWAQIELERMSQHLTENPFFNLHYGSNPSGIFVSAAVDMMHAYEEGPLKDTFDVFFNSLLNQETNEFLDEISVQCFLNVPRQFSRLQMPRIAFTGGITKLTTLAAHEYSGLSFSFALLFQIKEVRDRVGKQLKNAGISTQVNHYTDMFADMFAFARWTKEGPFYRGKQQSDKIGNGVNQFLSKQLLYFPRRFGCFWNLQKVHDITHAYYYMRRYGSLMNFDTGHTERLLKFQAKELGRNALSWTENLFRKSSSTRAEEGHILQKAAFASAHQQAFIDGSDMIDSDEHSQNTDACMDTDDESSSQSGTAAYRLSRLPYGAVLLDANFCSPNYFCFKYDSSGSPLCAHDTVISFVGQELKNKRLRCALLFPECVRRENGKNTRYRASPLYKTNPWYDWCWLDYELQGSVDHKKALKEKLYVRQKNMLMTTGVAPVEKSAVHSCPGRLLAFCLFVDLPPGCPPIPETNDSLMMRKWANHYCRTNAHNEAVPPQVVVHTTLAKYKAQHVIGTEFTLQTSKNRDLNVNKETGRVHGEVDPTLVPKLTPLYRLESCDMLGDHVFVFEFEGAMSHYYNRPPPVIAVRAMHNDISSNFLERYCK